MKLTYIRKVLLSVLAVILTSLVSYGQQTLWVGETYTFDVGSSVVGLTANMSWSTSGGYISLSGSGYYRDIKVTQYFSGTATVTCEWDYKLTGNGSYTHVKRQVTISCRDNKVSISPTSLTMSPGETRHISYRHQYDNQYTSEAEVSFETSDPSVCTVSSSGEVCAEGPGTAYVNVYSTISSGSPYCLVTVKEQKPTSISIPSSLTLTAGEQKTIYPTLYPSNAKANISWESSNPEIASVSSGGTVSGLKHGTTKITARTDNGLSSTCNVTVEKSQLSISASHSSGLVTKGTPIQLIASDSGANIFYTTDGSNPSSSSLRYSNPIPITEDTQIKAVAVHSDYLDSDILDLNFEVTSLSLERTIPEQGITQAAPHLYPCFVFNQDIKQSSAFDDIRLYSDNDEITFEKVIEGNKLFIVPETLVGKKIWVVIPQDAVKNYSNEINVTINSQFDYTSAKPTHVSKWTSNSRIMDNGDCYIWGYPKEFPDASVRPDNYSGYPKLAVSNINEIYCNGITNYYITIDHTLKGCGPNYYDYYPDSNPDNSILGDDTIYHRDDAVFIANDVVRIETGWTKGLIKTDGSLWLWGQNRFGQIGNGKWGENNYALSPTHVLSNVKDFSLGTWHSLALKNDGSVWAWGYNNAIARSSNSCSPIKYIDSDVIEIQAGSTHNVILKSNGDVYCFGENKYGQIGKGYKSTYEGLYKVMSDARHIYACFGGSYALKQNGELYRWGITARRTETESLIPTLVTSDVKEVFVDNENVAVLKNDNSLWCMGSNAYGLLGLGYKDANDYRSTLSKVFDDVDRAWLVGSKIIVQKLDGTYWGIGAELGISDKYETYVEPVQIFKETVVQTENISLPDKIIIEIDQKGFAQVEITPTNANYESIEWTSQNPSIAEISNNGVITPVSLGETAIEVRVIDNMKNFSATCQVQVVEKGSGIDEILSSSGNDSISIYDVNGVKLYEGNQDSIPSLTPGIYIIASQGKTIKFFKR